MLNVGIGEYAISSNPEEKIITYALGSCVAFIVYCPVKKWTALAHIVLPKKSNFSQEEFLVTKPSYFAEDIVPSLLDYFIEEKHCVKEQLMIHLVGGANSLNGNDIFRVGQRNTAMVQRILCNYNLTPCNIQVGGNISRTVSVSVKDGALSIKQQNMII